MNNRENKNEKHTYIQKQMPPSGIRPFGIRRKLLAHKTTEVWQNVPHAAYAMECDVSEFLGELEKLNASGKYQKKIKLNTLILRALVEAVFAAPHLNAHLDYDHKTKVGIIKQFEEININMPWMTDDGKLIIVKLADFGKKDLGQMTDYIENLRERVEITNTSKALIEISLRDTKALLKEGKILDFLNRWKGVRISKKLPHPPAEKISKKEFESLDFDKRLNYKDLDYGTILFSNVGYASSGIIGKITLMDLAYPQVFACAIGTIQEKPWVVTNEEGQKEIAIRKIIPFCLVFDHRAYDFGDIAPFAQRLNEVFKNPEIIRNW